MGLVPNFSLKGWTKNERRSGTAAMEVERCCWMGNTFQVHVISWLIGQLLREHGVWRQAPSPQQCVDGISEKDLLTFSSFESVPSGSKPEREEAVELQLVRFHLRNVNHKGSDVRVMTGELFHPNCWPRKFAKPSLWRWRAVISFTWPERMSALHINDKELRAYLSAVRWRARALGHLSARFLHLCDSQVSLAVLLKGRSSSRKPSVTLQRIDAVQLAGNLRPFHAYVATELNPADRPFRWRVLRRRLKK